MIFLAFRIPTILRLLLELDTYEGIEPLGVFPLILKLIADIIAPKLIMIFQGLISLGSFPECWRSSNGGSLSVKSYDREIYRPKSITLILSKVYYSLLIGNVWAVLNALLTIIHHIQKSLDAGMKPYIVQLDFSAAFDRVSHNGLN